jgi:hypothetical protein
MDIYINGNVAQRYMFTEVPKQNYNDVLVGANGGFSGYTSNLWYYDYALGTAAIQSLVSSGPNTNMVGGGGMDLKNPNYLSLRWFFYGDNDGYNP